MLYPDLGAFIADLDRNGELVRIKRECDPELEIAAITVEMCKRPPSSNKAILFEKVKGSTMPVLTNAFGSEKRLGMMAGVADYSGFTSRLSGLLELLQQPRRTLVEKIKVLPVLREVSRCFPKTVRRGACQQVVWRGDQIDLTKIPILKTWPLDGGPFVTLPLVFTKDPRDGKRNCGMYRLQRYDRNTLGFHCHTHHTGAAHLRAARALGRDRLEVAVAIGAEPAVTFSAVVPLPPGLDEMIVAGFLNQAPVKMVRCVSIDAEVPASAEIVLEGYVKVDERRREGPFGDHTGHYSLADDYWVFHVTAVTTRENPVYHATVVGPPPQEDNHITTAIERLFLPLMQQPIPEVEDYWLPFEGVAHNLLLARIRKAYPGQGRKVAHAIWGLGQAMFTKVIAVTDETGPALQDAGDWARRLARDLDAESGIEFVRGPTETLDHASRALHFGSKVSLDVTRPMAGEGRDAAAPVAGGADEPGDADMLATLKRMVPGVRGLCTPFKGEWRHLTLVALDKTGSTKVGTAPTEPGVRDTTMLTGASARDVFSALWTLYPELPCAQRVIVFDAEEKVADLSASNLSRLVWMGLSNIDPERDFQFDLIFDGAPGTRRTRRHPRRIGVDCTTKALGDGFTRQWPLEQTYPPELLRNARAVIAELVGK